jgi:RNA polymerase sigma-70 factor (ECF subfamily)
VRHAEITDSELLSATRRDPGMFAVFYDRYEASIVGYFLGRTRDAELTADLTAEVFAAALGAAGRYRPESGTAAPWLFTIARHTLARSIRRGRVEARARRRLGIDEAFELESSQIDRIHAAVAGDQWVSQLLAGLPADQQKAIRARILDELPYSEIAGRLQTSELVIRKRVSRGIATLREQLEDPS